MSDFIAIQPDQLPEVEPECKQLWVCGQADIPGRKIGFVGSRQLNQADREYGQELAAQIAQRAVIVSGLAIGSDQLGHQAALNLNKPTIACIGSGFLNQPGQQVAMARNIYRTGGAIYSEYQPDQKTEVWQLIHRNRLISAMSEAVVMFRSSSSGGTLYTVRDAWRQGKPVYTDQGSEAGKILLEEPELKLPGLLKQFQLKKSEQEQLSDQPLAKHVSELIENLLN